MRDLADGDGAWPEGFAELDAYWRNLDAIRGALTELSADVAPALAEELARLVERIDAFEPSVSLLGQVKSGKSTLLNALIGQPALLPADVNPWTSVITNVHLNSPRRPPDTRALFRFFDALEWDRLVTTGGRLGEMAARVGFETEAEQIRAQVMQMRRATEDRLGADFQDLLGTSHAFPDLARDVIDRYICYGDAGDRQGRAQGFFADVTKTADLYLDLPDLPKNLCLRDTPGLNDTFMMREQITVNAVSESRVCVVVLSAHQPLSTMDMALLRIIGNVEAREILIFVNRIDELADPVAQTAEIEAAIRRTLQKAGIGSGLPILFGSALWAIRAVEDRCDTLPEPARQAIARLAAHRRAGCSDGEPPLGPALRRMAEVASGVPDLHRAIASRIVAGPGQAMIDDIEAATGNVISEVETVGALARAGGRAPDKLDRDAIKARARAIGEACSLRLRAGMAETGAVLSERLRRAQDQFVDSAVAALAAHIAAYGSPEGWRCDPMMLRMMIRSSFLSSCRVARGQLGQATAEAAEGYARLLCEDLAVPEGSIAMHLPAGPMPQAPAIIAQTMALDMQVAWWRRFFQRRGTPEDRAHRYRDLIFTETAPLIEEVGGPAYAGYCEDLARTAEDFCRRQQDFVNAVLEAMDRPADLSASFASLADALTS